MKKFNNQPSAIFLVIIFILLSFILQISAGDNLVSRNPGFEDSIKNTDEIPGWNINYWSKTPKQEIKISKERASKGSQSLKINLQRPNPRNRFGFTLFQKLPLPDPEKDWNLGFDYWSDAEIRLKLVISCGPGNKIPYEFKFYDTKNDKKWHQVNITLPAFKFTKENILWDKKNVWLELCVYSKVKKLPATLFIDNVNLCVVAETQERVSVSPQLIKKFYEVKAQTRKIPEVQKAFNEIALLVKRASRRKELCLEEKNQITNTVNWAEQKLTAFSSQAFKNCEIWAIDAVQDNYPSPEAIVINGKLTDKFELTLAKDQFEPVCFLLHADVNLNKLRFTTAPFTDSQDKKVPGIEMDLRVVKWWYQDHGGISGLERTGVKVLKPELLLHDDSLVKINKIQKSNSVRIYNSSEYVRVDNSASFTPADAKKLPDKDADILLPLSIKAKSNRILWLLIKAGKDASAGEYNSKIEISDENGRIATLKIKVRILPFVLDKPSYYSSIYYRSPNYTNEPGYPPCYSTEQAWKQYAAEMKNLYDHGIDMVRFDRAKVQTTWKMWPYMEDILRRLKIRKSIGMRTDIVFLSYPVQNPQSSQELKELENKVRKLVSELVAHGVKEVYFYGLDEARGERLRSQRKAWKAVHKGGGKIYAAGFSSEGVHDEFGNLLDLFICEGTLSRQEAVKWHNCGKKIGSYGNPQGGIEKPELYRKNYGVRMWQYGYDAAMTYVYHNAPIQTNGSLLTAWNDFALNSDIMKQLMMVYPTAEGIIDTLQWEGYREGVNDVRYITTLERLCNELSAKGEKNNAVTEAGRFLKNLKKGDVVKDKTNMENLRKQIMKHISRIIALKSSPDNRNREL